MANPKSLISIGGPQSAFQGIGGLISPENIPPYMFQKLINWEPAIEIGTLKKRNPYANVITGQTNLTEMAEVIDKNGSRLLVIQKGTNIYTSVYSGGSYGALTQVDTGGTDLRHYPGETPNIYRLRPHVFQKVLRSGAGLDDTSNIPIWYGYIDAQTRFPDATSQSISAGRYLCEGILHGNTLKDVFELSVSGSNVPASTTAFGINLDLTDNVYYYIYYYLVPVYDGYQIGFPSEYYKICYPFVLIYDGSVERSHIITITMDSTYLAKLPRLTHVDLFASVPIEGKFEDYASSDKRKIVESYFLERIPLTANTDAITTVEGTYENANPPTYIEFTPDSADFETADYEGFYIEHGSYQYKLGARSWNGDKAQYAITGGAAALQNTTVDAVIRGVWEDDGTDRKILCLYDNHYRKQGAYMYTHCGLPDGDLGLDDIRYKYCCEANRRFFYFGMDDGFGRFSLADRPDVVPALNLIRPKFPEVGCIGVGRDVFLFSKFQTTRITVITEGKAEQDDEFLNFGLTNSAAIVKTTDYEIAWMSYKGPVMAVMRDVRFIGSQLHDWWIDEFTAAEKESCIAGYNYHSDQIWFAFPDYSTAPFTNGVIFVFDVKAYKNNFISPWFTFKSDTKINYKTLNDDGDFLTGSDTKIVNWNSLTDDEDVDTLLRMLVLKNPRYSKRAKLVLKKLFIDYVINDNDTITAKIYKDGSSSAVTLTLNDNYEAFLHYIVEQFEIEIITASNSYDASINRLQCEFRPKRF